MKRSLVKRPTGSLRKAHDETLRDCPAGSFLFSFTEYRKRAAVLRIIY